MPAWAVTGSVRSAFSPGASRRLPLLEVISMLKGLSGAGKQWFLLLVQSFTYQTAKESWGNSGGSFMLVRARREGLSLKLLLSPRPRFCLPFANLSLFPRSRRGARGGVGAVSPARRRFPCVLAAPRAPLSSAQGCGQWHGAGRLRCGRGGRGRGLHLISPAVL